MFEHKRQSDMVARKALLQQKQKTNPACITRADALFAQYEAYEGNEPPFCEYARAVNALLVQKHFARGKGFLVTTADPVKPRMRSYAGVVEVHVGSRREAAPLGVRVYSQHIEGAAKQLDKSFDAEKEILSREGNESPLARFCVSEALAEDTYNSLLLDASQGAYAVVSEKAIQDTKRFIEITVERMFDSLASLIRDEGSEELEIATATGFTDVFADALYRRLNIRLENAPDIIHGIYLELIQFCQVIQRERPWGYLKVRDGALIIVPKILAGKSQMEALPKNISRSVF